MEHFHNLFILFIVLIILYFVTVDDDASSDPSWITLDEICGIGLVTIGSGALPLLSWFLVLD